MVSNVRLKTCHGSKPNCKSTKMKTLTSTFILREEAFLLNILYAIFKICARGSGKASFSRDVSDVQAALNLSFQLSALKHPFSQELLPLKAQHSVAPSTSTAMSATTPKKSVSKFSFKNYLESGFCDEPAVFSPTFAW